MYSPDEKQQHPFRKHHIARHRLLKRRCLLFDRSPRLPPPPLWVTAAACRLDHNNCTGKKTRGVRMDWGEMLTRKFVGDEVSD